MVPVSPHLGKGHPFRMAVLAEHGGMRVELLLEGVEG
jgi:hypothetical protein